MVLRVRGLREQVRRPAGIMRTLAQGVELQTKVRIRHEKTAPDGKAWAPWSRAYARTRKAGTHSLLMDTWAMSDDKLSSKSTATTATIQNSAPYAGYHQGGTSRTVVRAFQGLGIPTATGRMPARPFLGISAQNARDIEHWLAPALEQMTRGALRG